MLRDAALHRRLSNTGVDKVTLLKIKISDPLRGNSGAKYQKIPLWEMLSLKGPSGHFAACLLLETVEVFLCHFAIQSHKSRTRDISSKMKTRVLKEI